MLNKICKVHKIILSVIKMHGTLRCKKYANQEIVRNGSCLQSLAYHYTHTRSRHVINFPALSPWHASNDTECKLCQFVTVPGSEGLL